MKRKNKSLVDATRGAPTKRKKRSFADATRGASMKRKKGLIKKNKSTRCFFRP